MKVELTTYNPNWKVWFGQEKNRLLSLIAPLEPEIEHIGSTSVSGVLSKPIIDIMLGFKAEHELETFKEALFGRQGYVYCKNFERELPFRKFFIKVDPPRKALFEQIPGKIGEGEDLPEIVRKHRRYHLHAVLFDSEFWIEHLLFRDLLRKNPIVREQYSHLKQDLAQLTWKRVEDYSYAKADFIQGCLEGMRR